MDVTESELAWALRTTKIMVHDKDGLADLAGCFDAGTLVTRGKGAVWLPEEHAVMLLRKIEGEQKRRRAEEAECRAEGARCDREGGPCTCPCDPEAEAAALREPHPTGPRLADADLCARCGNQFKPGLICDACREDVVDAHVCCEHVPGDGELAVLVTVKRELDRLCLKPEGTMRRVLAYLTDSYGYVLADED
jgi:hypothetical protein